MSKAFWLVYQNVHLALHNCAPSSLEDERKIYSEILTRHAAEPKPAATSTPTDPEPKKKEAGEDSEPTLPPCPDSVAQHPHPTYFSRLFVPDNFHPTKLATYLIACVFYAHISRSSPRGLAWRPPSECNEFDCKMKDKYGESFEPEAVSEEDAAFMQDIAHRAVFGDDAL